LLVFKENTKKIEKSKFTKNKEVEGPICFKDQATLHINRDHNTHKKRGAILHNLRNHKKTLKT
jgi:hypothetical protein